MKSLIIILCMLSSLIAQTKRNFKNVVIETDNKLMFINWVRTDTSLSIYETVVDKKKPDKPIENYWWAKKEKGFWFTNLPKEMDVYIKNSQTKDDISWMNLPNVSKETMSIGFNYDLIFKKFSYWIDD